MFVIFDFLRSKPIFVPKRAFVYCLRSFNYVGKHILVSNICLRPRINCFSNTTTLAHLTSLLVSCKHFSLYYFELCFSPLFTSVTLAIIADSDWLLLRALYGTACPSIKPSSYSLSGTWSTSASPLSCRDDWRGGQSRYCFVTTRTGISWNRCVDSSAWTLRWVGRGTSPITPWSTAWVRPSGQRTTGESTNSTIDVPFLCPGAALGTASGRSPAEHIRRPPRNIELTAFLFLCIFSFYII